MAVVSLNCDGRHSLAERLLEIKVKENRTHPINPVVLVIKLNYRACQLWPYRGVVSFISLCDMGRDGLVATTLPPRVNACSALLPLPYNFYAFSRAIH